MQGISSNIGVPAIQYKGSSDTVSQIYNAYGIKGIYKGTNITLIREIFAYGGK